MASYKKEDRQKYYSLINDLVSIKDGTNINALRTADPLYPALMPVISDKDVKEKLRRELEQHPEVLHGKQIDEVVNNYDLGIKAVNEMLNAAIAVVSGESFAEMPTTKLEEERYPIDVIDVDLAENAHLLNNAEPAWFESTEKGETRIGDIVLKIPPEQISIIDSNTATAIPIARGLGSVKMLTGKGELRLEMTIEVESVTEYNNKIRPLIAQIKRTPWLPFDNWHIKKIFLPIDPLENPDLIGSYDRVAPGRPGGGGVDTPNTTNESISLEEAVLETSSRIDIDEIPISQRTLEQQLTGKVRPTTYPEPELFLVVHGISVGTNPGNPGYFYVTLTCGVFNHTPFANTIRYLIDDDDARNMIQGTLDYQNATYDTIDMRNRADTDPIFSQRYKVKTTKDIRKSKVYQKYYQGLLAEYAFTPGTTTISEDAPPKQYEGLPYNAGKEMLMGRLTEDQGQDIVLRGWIDKRTFADLVGERIAELNEKIKYIEGVAANRSRPRDLTIPVGMMKVFWDGIQDLAYIYTSVFYDISPMLERAGFKKSEYDPRISDGVIYIRHPITRRLTPLSKYVEELNEDEKTKKLYLLAKEFTAQKWTWADNTRGGSLVRPLSAFDVIVRNDERTTITGITASMGTNVIPIQLTGQLYPTFQHLGVGEFSCVINIQTTDYDLVRRIRFLNHMLNRTRAQWQRDIAKEEDVVLARKLFFRDFSIEILSADTDGGDRVNFLQSLGIRRAVMTDATYSSVKGQPGLFSITATLHQNDLDVIRQETIFETTGITEDSVRKVVEHLANTPPDRLNDPWAQVASQLQTLKAEIDEQVAKERGAEGELAREKGSRQLSQNEIAARKSILERVGHGILQEVSDAPMTPVISAGLITTTMALFGANVGSVVVGAGLATAYIGLQWMLNHSSKIIELYAINSTIRLYLSFPNLIEYLGRPDIVEKIRQEYNKDASLYNSCYPDLLLPSFVEPEPGKDRAIHTPADFYFARNEVIDSRVFDMAREQHKTSSRYVDSLAKFNKVGRDGRATLSLDPRNIRKDVSADSAGEITARIAERQYLINTIDELKRTGTVGGQAISRKEERIKELEISLEKVTRILKDRTVPYGDGSVVLDSSWIDNVEEEEYQYYAWGATAFDWNAVGNKMLNKVMNDLVENKRRDLTLSMARAYPTFKVYFVEEDDERFLSFNDVYSYNAIQSIDVISSRKSASTTAVIRMANLTGTLTDPLADRNRETGPANRLFNQKNQDTVDEQTVDSVNIRAGMRIIVRMGYSNNPAELTTVFDGAVVSVNPGDLVEVVCQSWAVELNNMIGMEGKDGIHIDSAAESTFGLHLPWLYKWFYDVGYGDIIRRILGEAGDLSHFGRRSPFKAGVNFQPDRPGETLLNKYGKAVIDFTQFGAKESNKRLTNRMFSFLNDPQDDNIWISWDRSIPWYALQEKETGSRYSFDWYIYRQSAWDAIQEVLLWFPGNIAVELPYNEHNLKLQRSTFYVGPRDGLYLAEDIDSLTNPLRAQQDKEWLRDKAESMYLTEAIGEIGFPKIDAPTFSPLDKLPPVGDLKLIRKGEIDQRWTFPPADTSFTTKGSYNLTKNQNNIVKILTSPDAVALPDRRPIEGDTAADITPHGAFDANRPQTTGVHGAVDYAAPIGTPVVATHAGTAVSGTARNLGLTVKITSADHEVVTQYGHLSRFAVGDGNWGKSEWVEAGRVIGYVGDSGNAKGTLNPHVHYILKVHGERKNPEKLLPLGQLQAKTFQNDTIRNRGSKGFQQSEEKTKVGAPTTKDVKSAVDAFNLAAKDGDVDVKSMFQQMLNGEFRSWRPRNPTDLWGRPGFKKVTKTHFVDSYHHIISNNIRASIDEMWNKVSLYYPRVGPVPEEGRDLKFMQQLLERLENKLGTIQQLSALTNVPLAIFDTLTHPADQPIDVFTLWLDAEMDTASVKELHTFQKNIDPEPFERVISQMQAGEPKNLPIYYRIANAILANGLREMYTGTLTLMMDPSIRPWDRIYVYDYANEMTGVIGVEEVHHHIDFQTGATTTIVPDLVVEQQDLPAVLSDGWYTNCYAVGAGAVAATLATTTAAGYAIAGGPGALIGLGAGAFAGLKVGNIIWVKVGGRLLGREPALKWTGLFYRNKPYVAGMEGVRRESTFAVVKNAIYSLADLTDAFGYTDIYGFFTGDESKDVPGRPGKQ